MSDWLVPVAVIAGVLLGQASVVVHLVFWKKHEHDWGQWRRIEEHYPSGNSNTRQIRRCDTCGREKVRDL